MKTAEMSDTRYRVLVIDDNQAIHDDLRKILIGQSAGCSDLLADEELLFQAQTVQTAQFEIDSAYQGEEGLLKLMRAMEESRAYSVAFVDIRMPPGWDGVETVSRLWEKCPELQVVICTAYSDYSWNDMVRKLGHSDSLVILKKPFDNIEVIQLAHALTQKWTASRQANLKRQELEAMVQRATQDLAHNATHDVLTDLPNRRLFADRLQQAVAMARRSGEKVGLLYVDLDGFKVVNDTLGHSMGDDLLREVVVRIKSRLRQCDTLARMGGDEFTLIATGLNDADSAATLAQRLRATLADPFCIEGHELFVTASIGISIYPRDGREVVDLLRKADAAMYEAKRQGRNRAVFFTSEIGQVAAERLQLESALRSALAQQQFELHYQPQFELTSQRLVRFEALLRWEHPLRGPIPPAKFIPIAEECGLIVPIGNWVIAEACRTARKWHDAGSDLPVAINVSAHQFCRPDFIDTVMDAIHSAGIEPSLVELELTETAIVNDLADFAPKIAQLREFGIGVAIDDFGSGYSSFSYLEKLPVAAVKIDRTFIDGLESTQRARSVVKGMVTLAHSIGLRVVVEGVETAGQLRALCESQADEVQGFLLGRPAPVERHLPELREPSAATATIEDVKITV